MSMTELRSYWLIGHYALGRDKFSAKIISIKTFHQKGLTQGLVWAMKAPGNGLLFSLIF